MESPWWSTFKWTYIYSRSHSFSYFCKRVSFAVTPKKFSTHIASFFVVLSAGLSTQLIFIVRFLWFSWPAAWLFWQQLRITWIWYVDNVCVINLTTLHKILAFLVKRMNFSVSANSKYWFRFDLYSGFNHYCTHQSLYFLLFRQNCLRKLCKHFRLRIFWYELEKNATQIANVCSVDDSEYAKTDFLSWFWRCDHGFEYIYSGKSA